MCFFYRHDMSFNATSTSHPPVNERFHLEKHESHAQNKRFVTKFPTQIQSSQHKIPIATSVIAIKRGTLD